MTRRFATLLRRIADTFDPPAPAAPAKGRELDMPRVSPIEHIKTEMGKAVWAANLGDVKPRPDRPAQLPGRGFYDGRAGVYL